MTQCHSFFGRVFVALDLLWTLGWFGISLWFIFDSTIADDGFRSAARNLLFHTANTVSVLYILRSGATKWGAIIPFVFVLVGDLEIGLRLILHLASTPVAARAVAIAWAWIAVLLTTSSIIWFIAAPSERKDPRSYQRF